MCLLNWSFNLFLRVATGAASVVLLLGFCAFSLDLKKNEAYVMRMVMYSLIAFKPTWIKRESSHKS